MDPRGTRSLGLLALRFLRRQRHAGLGRSSLGESENLAHISTLEGGGNGAIQRSSNRSPDKSFMKLPTSERLRSVLWQKQDSAPGPSSWSNELSNGERWGLLHLSSEKIVAARDGGAVSLTDQDFLSRYLQWRRFDTLANSQLTDVSCAADVAHISSDATHHCASFSHLSCPSSILHWDNIPMEASSVKRKRKKKMNKHKQRKLRRRDRHRN